MTIEQIIENKIKEQKEKIETSNKQKNYLEANIARVMIVMLNEILDEAKK